jgi:hypothetical protein
VHCAPLETLVATQGLASVGRVGAALAGSEPRTSLRVPWPDPTSPAGRLKCTCASVAAIATRFVRASGNCLPTLTSSRADPATVATAKCRQGRRAPILDEFLRELLA